MISAQIHNNVDSRLAEVQKLLALIRKLEALATEERDQVSAENSTVLRGLFFVHLYGALEYSITLSVQVLLQEMTKVAVPFNGFEHLLHVIALDAQFRSLADPGLKLKWQKRRELLNKQVSSEMCSLNDTVFQDQLQNIWYHTLHTIFDFLCVPSDAVPEVRMRGYLDEIVENRNAIAHGRQSAQEVGRRTTSTDLGERLDAVTKVVNHVIVSFEDYLENRHFVDARHRPNYIKATPQATSASTL